MTQSADAPPPLSIASWNVNSVRARLANVTDWLTSAAPDVVCLQEIKATEETFPYEAIEQAGYQAYIVGQKSYNGVALLSKEPLDIRLTALPGDPEDPQARYIEAELGNFIIACLYLPNGNPMGSEKYSYKHAWMRRLGARMAAVLAEERPAVFAGDFNIIPEPHDCYDPQAWRDDALFSLASRQEFQALLNLGYYDALRSLTHQAHLYTYWDYTGGAYAKDNGIRIDHLLLSPQATDRLLDCQIDREPRGREKASDHTPIIARLER